MFKFETLDIWKEALKFVDEIYELVKNSSDYNLNDQIKRAATSIVLNIAEGSGRGSKNDFKRFINIATGSLYERAQQLSKMLHGFTNYLEK